MALATLQDTIVPDISPPARLRLSHSPNHDPPYPTVRILRQFARSAATPHPLLYSSSIQTLFRWFRSAGPLVSIAKDVDIGYPETVISLEYWYGEHANAARIRENQVHSELSSSPEFTLRTYDPCNLYCAVSGTIPS